LAQLQDGFILIYNTHAWIREIVAQSVTNLH